MKVAVISTPWVPLPPIGYGGTEKVVYNLSENLRKKGHQVIVYATGDSKITSQLMYHYPKNLGVNMLTQKSHVYYMLNHVFHALKELPKDIDIIHNHCEYSAMYLLEQFNKPFVHTLHGAFYSSYDQDQKSTDTYIESIRETLALFKHQPFISISDYQRQGMADLNYQATVYNGININDFLFDEIGSDNISWVGRFSPLKGLDIVIQVAQKMGKKLVFSFFVNESRRQLFEEIIKPSIDYQTILPVEINNNGQKNAVFGKSKLFLFPVQWEEPFGLVMIESMATGTPVIAFARGSVPEVVKDGETGFIVNPSDSDIRGD